ncbi:glycosyltransferase family 2 protein [Burkholderia sp. LA-2-3-30-S1-D2]|uniref:glycosyltransferase family 2 protein n=1 Tax=Burkholderia sp. LA-2-3-30-S1-D2 TaxID=1637862 RepID=UPI000ACD25D3|nr:glycosyltransferase family 2 protein [Burkholderia sp. LA-2-3-30-S1-D2]
MVKTGSEEVAADINCESNSRTAMVWLIEGLAAGNGEACVATAVLTLDGGRTQDFTVLISSKGRIQELVKTDATVRAVNLVVDGDEKPVCVEFLHCRRLSFAAYRLRQLWRVARTLYKQPLQRCTRAGLTLATLFSDIDYAYDVACRFRANVFRGGYSGWYQEFYAISPADRALMARRAENWHFSPRFNIFLSANRQTTRANIDATRASLAAQTYQRFDVKLLEDDPAADWSRLISTPFEQNAWCLVIRAGVTLSEQALFCLADAVVKVPDAAVVYADHDFQRADRELHDPVFKPDWSPELLRSTNYIGEAFVWNSRYAHRLPEFGAEVNGANVMHALLLRLSELGSPMVHVPAPLWHLTSSEEPVDGAETARVVAAHLNRVGISAKVEATGPGRCRVRYAVAVPAPLVSIVIPTRDQLGHLRRCIASVLEKTRYTPYEILVVDNQSVERETLDYLRSLQQVENVRVLPFDEPFNYSRINNVAIAKAKGELVCLLNNDTEVISPDWLGEMVGVLSSTAVGAVGAKLLYEDDTVQHAGDTVGSGGCANHLHSGIGADEPGYAGRALVTQDLSAVTAACLLTRKSLYLALGGLNEKNLKVAFNDVDYCLRVRDEGLRVVWTPHALLYHFESRSRGKDVTPAQQRRARAEVRYMSKRWADVMRHDPFYNPNLNYLQADFALSATPSVPRPWAFRRNLIQRIWNCMVYQ